MGSCCSLLGGSGRVLTAPGGSPLLGRVLSCVSAVTRGFFAAVTSVSPWEEPLGAPALGCGHSLVDGDEGQLPWLKGIVSSLVYFN